MHRALYYTVSDHWKYNQISQNRYGKYEFCALVDLLMSMWTCSFKTYCYNK